MFSLFQSVEFLRSEPSSMAASSMRFGREPGEAIRRERVDQERDLWAPTPCGGNLILYTINPNLVNLNLPGLSSINIQAPSGGGTTGSSSSGYGGGNCTPPPSGPCSVATLQSTCMGNNAQAAAEICSAESSGNAVAGGDKSTNGQPVSIGLFQINLSANNLPGLNCTAAFNHTWSVGNPSTITNSTLYNQCVTAAQNIATNISYACTLSHQGTNWGAWSTHTGCGL